MRVTELLFVLFGAFVDSTLSEIYYVATETEMFSIPLTPNMFNWTYQEFDKQYRFRASLLNKPELPSWLRYVYSDRHHSGFIFGTPPRHVESPVTLEIIGLNRQDFETRRLLIPLTIKSKPSPVSYEVQLKIDNLNVEDLLDEHRLVRLKEIFTIHLWPESTPDLHATFLASALEFGARLPLLPTQGEGLIVRLGSTKEFSSELKRLRNEVRPLAKLSSCPRDYKRTTVERLFREHFTIDWCSFKLYTSKYTKKGVELKEYTDDQPNLTPSSSPKDSQNVPKYQPWSAPSSLDLPTRSYTSEAFLALTVPLLLMLLSVTALTAVLCCHFVEGKENVEMCRYSNEHRGADRTRNPVSPTNGGVAVPFTPKSQTNIASAYNRPEPPPYGSQRCGKSPSECSKTLDLAPTTLEESLRLIEEANIVPEAPAKTWFC